MSKTDKIENETKSKDGKITYFVNDESYDTTEKILKVHEILSNADFIPVEKYDLTLIGNNKPYDRLDEEIKMKNNDRFIAVFKGTTPVS